MGFSSYYGIIKFCLTMLNHIILVMVEREFMKIMKMNVLLKLNVEIINRSFPVNQFLALTMIEVYREEFCLGRYVSIGFMRPL